ncbi:hypothetical protein IGI04_021244 [Brassica rapa subsp. trilocularis]|uniref:Uncharacterized protein n=1 Tax=Brassica rapa subsp. trilocularis TaxID=1813537 RepID=A0ABQ7MNG6_BRACM|nr:hypothetical protein IGI04_021244 [Brassica rapa subsp. trilocularis]
MEDEDVDIGYNEQPISRISPVRTHKDKAVGNSTQVVDTLKYLLFLFHCPFYFQLRATYTPSLIVKPVTFSVCIAPISLFSFFFSAHIIIPCMVFGACNQSDVKSVPRLLSSPELIQGPSMRGIGVAFEWSDNQFPKEKTSSSQWIG